MSPLARGTLTAVAAAVLFGATTPLVKHFGAQTGPFATAALLYVGSALGGGVGRQRGAARRLTRHWKRIAVVALLGAALAPACLAFGLQHSGALAAALLLNCEAVFTVLLARAVYREPLGARVITAALVMLIGGGLLALRSRAGTDSTWLGLAAIVLSTFAWALDNTLTRALADLDPREVVVAKSVLGAALSLGAAWVVGEHWASALPSALLIVCGVFGYGLSLRFYLRAQRVLGAARTGSLFAVAPFVGAALAFAAGDREQGALVAGAALAFGVAIYLHASEHHHHLHRHEELEHEHAHRHDDGHHTHHHDFEVVGEHTHRHRHESLEHEHAHGSDLHHRHDHD